MTSIGNDYISGLQSSPASPAAGGGASGMDMNSFLKLMTTQLKMQDPFSPMDNSQMVAQMATFSQVSGIAQMNTTLSKMSDTLGGLSGDLSSSRIANAANWIGRSMLVKSDIATPDRYGTYGGQVTLASDAANLNIDLVDANGHVVKSFDLGSKSAGQTVPFYWDGKDADGNSIDPQALKVAVRGAATASISSWAAIAGVQSPADSANTKLITAIGNFTPADALQIN